jgi:hypothetical protein
MPQVKTGLASTHSNKTGLNFDFDFDGPRKVWEGYGFSRTVRIHKTEGFGP